MITMSYGGGKQTIAIITMILDGKLPRPDLIVFADTGHEVKTTFDYLKTWVQPALKSIGLQVETITQEYATETEAVLLPVYTRQSGHIGKMPTFCSNEWKQRPVRRWLKAHGVTDTDLWLGISLDEAERMKGSGLQWLRHVYPLIEIVPMNRAACVNQIQSFGWPVPSKSRCYMCPNQSPLAWKDLKRRADGDFEKAVELENEIREKDPLMFFHPLAKPLKEAVEQSEQQADMFDGCDSGFCFT